MEHTRQFTLTPAMGKRLIGKGLAAHPAIAQVLKKGTLAIIAGTTNAYVAEEILRLVGQGEGFARKGFRRGMTVPPGFNLASLGAAFSGDVILIDGRHQPGKTIFDIADTLTAGDIVLKGGNALDVRRRVAAVYIGDRKAGTIGAVLGPVVGRRVRLIVPIGLEKRVLDDIAELAALVNAPTTAGPGLLPMPGEPYTELDAVATLTGCAARLLAAGGTCGAEGAVWLGVTGTAAQLERAEALMGSLAAEPLYHA